MSYNLCNLPKQITTVNGKTSYVELEEDIPPFIYK